MNTVISRLCSLITVSLPPAQLIQSEGPSRQTKQSERDALISLSRVRKQIKRWKDEFDYEAEEDMVADSSSEKTCCLHQKQAFDDDYSCIADITTLMVSYMGFKSEFVQHLAGNILIAISDLLIKFESAWLKFLHHLVIKLEAAMLSINRSTFPSSSHEDLFAEKSLEPQLSAKRSLSGLDILTPNAAPEPEFDKASIYMVTGLFRTLHRIFKLLKHVKGDLEGTYVHLARDFLLNMPKNMFGDIYIGCLSENQINSKKTATLDNKKCFSECKGILLGTILQFLCSYVTQKECCSKKDALHEKTSTPSEYTDLLNLVVALPEHLICSSRSLSLYLRHKALMLMIKLRSHLPHNRSHIPVWLKLLKSHFGDLLYEPISQNDVDCSASLEDSPFISSFDDGEIKYSLCTKHLRRQAIFLFFHCCFHLTNFDNKTHQEHSHPGEVYYDTCKMQYGTNVGFLEFSDWLHRCSSLDKLAEYNIYRKTCCSFALSFLQFYADEDDMLFEMLLLLQDAPFFTLRCQSLEKKESYEEKKNDRLFHIFNAFHPIHLFHLLLILLHYDHLVLVDYLISNDAGTHFLQYLLRCLRMICGSWDIFTAFEVWECDAYQPCYKRRKLSIDVAGTPNFSNLSPLPSEVEGHRTRKETCENAITCLLSLKKMVEDLHRKNLFPYNPEPLIRRLNSFEDCCNKQEM